MSTVLTIRTDAYHASCSTTSTSSTMRSYFCFLPATSFGEGFHATSRMPATHFLIATSGPAVSTTPPKV